jgi:hypothetical protein
MSQRKLKPPLGIASYTKHFRCSDCDSITGKPEVDEHGMWHVPISHDDWCPVLAGHVSVADMHTRAMTQSARDGHRAVAVVKDPSAGDGVR